MSDNRITSTLVQMWNGKKLISFYLVGGAVLLLLLTMDSNAVGVFFSQKRQVSYVKGAWGKKGKYWRITLLVTKGGFQPG